MKFLQIIALVFISGLLLSASCKKHVVTPQNQLSLLPPVTQTGANTFGCLINGQAFVPGGSIFNGAPYQCNYIYTAGGYYLTVAADNKEGDGTITDIVLGTDSLAVSQGQTLLFKRSASGNAQASYNLVYAHGGLTSYITKNPASGQLIISRFDPAKQIVSGTFYFNAVNASGDTVKVTDGRFDMPYTR